MENQLKIYSKNTSSINICPTALYENYVGDEQGFLLESYSKEEGRYSFIGKNPYEKITSTSDCTSIEDLKGNIRKIKGNPIEALKEYMNSFKVKNTLDLPFEGGLVGAIGYDFIRYSEEIPNTNDDEIGIEPVQLWLVLEFLCIDHITNTITAVVLENESSEGEGRAINKLEKIIDDISNITVSNVKENNKKLDGKVIARSDTVDSYSEKVNKAKHYIKEGHIFQVVLSQRWCIESSTNGFQLFKDLRELNPSPYLYYFNYDEFEIIGSSPEMLVKKTGDKVLTCPIAGTRKRGSTKEEDLMLEKELIEDEKERAEHVMLVDLARNDMGKIAKFDSVNVTEFMSVHYYSHVMHIVSLVEGLNNNHHPLDILASFLPAGTLSGAPKIRAMEIIDELETFQRGLYGGAIGYFGFNGNIDYCITIRTMIKKDNRIYLQAGAGIVADSVPEIEYEECRHKAKALSKILLEEVEEL